MDLSSCSAMLVSRDWVDYSTVIISGALLLAGVVGVNAALRSLRVGEKAANAALLNAQALIVSERPWLVVGIAPHESDSEMFIIRATNKGNTPAMLHEGHCACKIHSAMGFEPPDEICDPFYAPMDILTMKGEGFEIRRVAPERMRVEPNPNASDPGALYVYGRLMYWDAFTDRSEPDAKPFVTQWCFTYNPLKKEFHRTSTKFTLNT